jgi:hypothetical protein
VGQLFRSGIIRRIGRGRNVYYQANPDCPVFEELKSLVVKTAGVGDVLRAAFTPLADRIKKSAGIKKMKRKNNDESEN